MFEDGKGGCSFCSRDLVVSGEGFFCEMSGAKAFEMRFYRIQMAG
jgi:hypothetical protein